MCSLNNGECEQKRVRGSFAVFLSSCVHCAYSTLGVMTGMTGCHDGELHSTLGVVISGHVCKSVLGDLGSLMCWDQRM